jgi:membrane fusion protein (multidrug efflux system)
MFQRRLQTLSIFAKTLYVTRSSIIFIAFLLLFLPACSSKRKKEVTVQQKSGPRPPAKVDGYIVETQLLSETLEIPGTIISNETTEVHPEVSGRVTGLYVREGAQVGKGALLAKLYDADLQAQKRKLLVQLQIAQQTQARHQKLVEIGGISKEDYSATALQVNNIRADLDIINTAIRKTEVRAPFSGKLGLKETSTGAFVTPQSVITKIQKTTGLQIDFNLPEKYTSKLRPGHYVNFTVEGSARNYTAVVTATQSGIEQTTRSLTIRANVKGDEAGLVPGSFAKVKLAFDPDPNALMIPSQAIVPQARGKKVYVVKDGKAAFVEVVTGVRDSSNVQVISGLNKGDTVVVTGLLSLKPDSKVIIKRVINRPEKRSDAASKKPSA